MTVKILSLVPSKVDKTGYTNAKPVSLTSKVSFPLPDCDVQVYTLDE